MTRIHAFLIALLLALLNVIASCDSLQDDVAPNAPLFELTDQGLELYATPGRLIVINVLDGVVMYTAAPYNIQITKQPEKGEVQVDPQGLILYQQNQTFTQGRDYLSYAVIQNGNTIFSQNLTIVVSADTASFPCTAGALSDSLSMLVNTIDQLLPVLQNDKICPDATKNVSLIRAPVGQIRWNGNEFVYTPKSGFQGEDSFIYQLCQTSNTSTETHCSYAYVNLYVLSELPCWLRAANDYFSLLYYGNDTTYQLNVLANDSWCRAEKIYPELLDQKEKAGVSSDGLITYRVTPNTYLASDSIRYSLCQDSKCNTASVLLTLERK